MTAWETIAQMITELEQKAERAEDRGLEHGTPTDIVSAQMALGAKRAVSELRRMIANHHEIEKRIEAAAEEKLRKRDEQTARRRAAKLANQTAQPDRTYEPAGSVAEFPKAEGAA